MIEIALGKKHTLAELPEPLLKPDKAVAATYLMFSKTDGKVGGISGLDVVSKLPNVIVDIQKREGSTVYNRAIMGTIRVFGKDIEELIETLKIINANLKAVDENGDNMFVYFTDYESLRKEYFNGLEEFNIKS